MSGVANNPYLEASRDDLLRIMTAPNAGAHNAVYRGKCLGGSVTDAQYAAIAAGTFDDLYIGDYWTIGGVNYRLAAFNYFLYTGETNCTTNHVVIVPDTCLYNAAMNSTKTTDGGYVGSEMYKTNLEQAKTIIQGAFSGHVLNHRISLTTAVTDGRASDSDWYSSKVDLMCVQMVYGTGVFAPLFEGNNISNNDCLEKSQLPLFQHEPSRICIRKLWWLRDVVSARTFAVVNTFGDVATGITHESFGVRPYFCIK